MHVSGSHRCSIASLLLAGIALGAGCGGVAPSGGAKASSALATSSSTLAFGSVPKNKSSKLTDTVTNTGTSTITISAANISGTGFSLSGLDLPMNLTSNKSVTFTVIFAPAASGSVSGMLAIVSTAANPTLNIALSGAEMAQGQLSISPASLGFGNVVVGANKSLHGALEASASSVTISAANSDSNEFVLSGVSLPATLTAGETMPFTVTFNPTVTGSASATISFSSDATNSPTAQSLTGKGAAEAQHSVDLTWDASTGTGVVGYNIYRGGAPGGPYAKLNSALEASTAYTDDSVTASHTYYYVTTAVTGSGDESGYSNQVHAVIPDS